MNVTGPSVSIEGRALTYGQLSQTNPEYDAGLWEEIDDFYEGGYTMQRKAAKYLPQLTNEHATRYDERCRTAGYQPYFGQIVDQFGSELFGQPLNVTPAADADNPNTPGEVPDKVFYGEFAKDCDLRQTPFVDLISACMTTALNKRRAYVQIDAPALPPGEQAPETRADEEARGLRYYAYEVAPEELIDWRNDDRGGFVWVIVRKCEQVRATPYDSRSVIHESFTIWSMRAGVAVWERYGIDYLESSPPKPETPVPFDAEGVTAFKRIPIHRLEIKKGLWVGNKIGPMAREHFQRRSSLISAQNRSLVAIPVVQLAGPIGAPGEAIPAEIQQDESRGDDPVGKFEKKGFLVLGADDKHGFMQPSPDGYELTDKQLEHLREAMFQVNHQMAASIRPTSTALGRSGLSKQKDSESTAKVLRALGQEARKFAVLIYETISAARGEDVVWSAHGLDSYESDDRESVLEEAISLDQIPIPSPTFKRAYYFQTAKRLLPGADPQTLSTIQDEINKGVDAEMRQTAAMDKAAIDAARNSMPAQPPKPGQKAAAPAPGVNGRNSS